MRHKKNDPPGDRHLKGGSKTIYQTVGHLADTENPHKDQPSFAERWITRRARITPQRARVVAGLAGFGGAP